MFLFSKFNKERKSNCEPKNVIHKGNSFTSHLEVHHVPYSTIIRIRDMRECILFLIIKCSLGCGQLRAVIVFQDCVLHYSQTFYLESNVTSYVTYIVFCYVSNYSYIEVIALSVHNWKINTPTKYIYSFEMLLISSQHNNKMC